MECFTPDITGHITGHIKSFVRRQSRMTQAQAQALDNHFPQYEFPLNGADLHQAFGSSFHSEKPVILEIGYGAGESLLHQAQLQNDHLFIGIEIHRPGIGQLLHQIVSKQIHNIRLICKDAVEVLKQLPDAQLSGIQIFFPDPWPKKRHHKRRLVQAAFLDLIYPKLKEGAFIHCATDWQDYADQLVEVFAADPRFQGGIIPRPEHRIITRFEERGLAKGHVVTDLIYRIK